MRVLMIAPTPFFADRGCHTQIYEEIKALQKLGHEVLLCTYGLGRDVPGVTTRRTINFPWYRKLSAGPSKTKILLLPFLTLTVFIWTLRFKPEVIHGHLHEGALIARFIRLLFPRKKYVFDMQGSLSGEILQHGFVNEKSLFFRLILWLEKKIVGWSFVITQSETMIAELKRLGASESRIANVKDGVDTDVFRPMPPDEKLARQLKVDLARPRVLYMGLLEEYQGVNLMLQAFASVKKKCAQAQFLIIGYPNIEKYKAMAESLGIGDSALFLGKIDYQTLPSYLSLAEVTVAPKISATEGDGKIYNYMAMALPTVAWDRAVAREILGDSGVFAEMANTEAMASELVSVLSDRERAREIGARARTRAIAHLSWDAVGQRINEVYKRL